LWDSLEDAAADLEAEFSSPNVADWKRAIADEDIRATTTGIVGVPAIDWQNRPTFQQVVQIGSLDHYKCYRTKRAKGSIAFGGATAALADAFETKNTSVIKPVAVCAAANKEGEGVNDPTAHLACYRIKQLAGQAKLAPATVAVGNQFGGETQTLKKAATLCVPAELEDVASLLELDSFKCYRSRIAAGTPKFTRRTVSVEDAFDNKSTIVLKPSQVCPAVDKDGAGVRDAAAALACYRIKNAPGQAKFAARDVAVDDEYGGRTDRLLKPSTLCVPSALMP
jgi:hypothetical protein